MWCVWILGEPSRSAIVRDSRRTLSWASAESPNSLTLTFSMFMHWSSSGQNSRTCLLDICRAVQNRHPFKTLKLSQPSNGDVGANWIAGGAKLLRWLLFKLSLTPAKLYWQTNNKADPLLTAVPPLGLAPTPDPNYPLPAGNLDGANEFSDIALFISLLSTRDFQAEANIDQSAKVRFSNINPFIQNRADKQDSPQTFANKLFTGPLGWVGCIKWNCSPS